jgi:hypothetical protein
MLLIRVSFHRQRDALDDRLVNLKIKSAQSFRCVHMNMVCVRVFIEVSTHMCMSICACTVFLKKHAAQTFSNPSSFSVTEHAIMSKFQKTTICSGVTSNYGL